MGEGKFAMQPIDKNNNNKANETIIDNLIYNKLTRVEESIMIPLFLLAVVIGFVNVVLRYLFQQGMFGAEELFTFAFVWAIFIGFSTALKKEMHVEVTIFYNMMPPTLQKICELISSLVGLSFCFFFTYYGYDMVVKHYSMGGVTMDTRLPMWMISIILPVSGLLLGVSFLYRIYRHNLKKIT